MHRDGTAVAEYQPLGLIPALSWKTRVLSLRDVPAGQALGYNGAYVTPAPARIAVIAAGYGDGLYRRLSPGGYVLLRGQRAPMLGRISMDLTIVDVTHIPGVEIGDEVVLIGRSGDEQITAVDHARWSGTIRTRFCAICRNASCAITWSSPLLRATMPSIQIPSGAFHNRNYAAHRPSSFCFRLRPCPRPGPATGHRPRTFCPQHQRMGYFLGDWTASGTSKISPKTPAAPFTLKEHGEWVTDGYFLETKTSMKSDLGTVNSQRVMGYNVEDKVYTYNVYNSLGEHQVALGHLNGNTWTWNSEEKLNGIVITGRYTIVETGPNTFTFKSEVADPKGGWVTVMEGKAPRVAPPSN